jgi:hypothetical protein
MKVFVTKFCKSRLHFIALCFVLSFTSSSVSGEGIKNGLSVENVYIFYSNKDETLKVLSALLNIANTDITILAENLSTAFLHESDKHVCEIGAGIGIKYKDYRIIQSLYRFDPITLRPTESANINHLANRKPEDIVV